MIDELPRSVGAQYTTGEEWRNNSRKNQEAEPNGKTKTKNTQLWMCLVVKAKSNAVRNNIAEMATHSSVLAWRIPGTGEPGGLLSMGSHKVRHN